MVSNLNSQISLKRNSGLFLGGEEFLGVSPILSNSRAAAMSILIGDIVVSSLIFQIIHNARFSHGIAIFDPFLWGTTLVIVLTLYITSLYRPNPHISNTQIVVRSLISMAAATVVINMFGYLTKLWVVSPIFWRSVLLPFLLSFYGWVFASRWLTIQFARSGAARECYLVLSNDNNSEHFENSLRKSNRYGSLILLSEERAIDGGASFCSMKFLDDKDDIQIMDSLDIVLDSYARSKAISGIVVDPQIELSSQLCRKLMELRLKGLPIYDLKNYYQKFWYKFPPELLQDNWFTFGEGFNLLSKPTGQKLKRLFDVITSGLMLLVVLPLMLLAAIAIKLDSRGPIFYKQERTGLRGKPLNIYKFRSMVQDAEKYGAQWAQKRDPRITRVGYWLRLTRIDELPQLWNVLRGDMSMIGPRPERPKFDRDLEKQIPYYSLRYLIKPGITGWAQVNYPYGASVEDAYEKLSYDLYYIKNYSLLLDLFITLKTARVVFMGKGR